PEAAAVHGRLDPAGVRVLAGQAELFLVTGIIEARGEATFHFDIRTGQKLFLAFGGFDDVLGNDFIPAFLAVSDAHCYSLLALSLNQLLFREWPSQLPTRLN